MESGLKSDLEQIGLKVAEEEKSTTITFLDDSFIKYDNELIHIYTNYCDGFYPSSVVYDSDFILSHYFKTFKSDGNVLIIKLYSKNGDSLEHFIIRFNIKAFKKKQQEEIIIIITKLLIHLKTHFSNEQKKLNRSEVKYN